MEGKVNELAIKMILRNFFEQQNTQNLKLDTLLQDSPGEKKKNMNTILQ